MSRTARPDTVSAIARQLMGEHAEGRAFAPLEGALRPPDLDAAYAVQRTLVGLLEDAGRGGVAGYKIAIASRAIQELVGIDEPCGGVILASTVHAGPAEIRRADFVRLGLEFELAVRLRADMPAAAQPYTAESVGPYIDACMPAFELIEDRDADYASLDLALAEQA